MPTRPHQEIISNPGLNAARMAAYLILGLPLGRTLAPVAVARPNGMDSSRKIEKDGTGIGTGTDTERQPELGAWSGLAQDVSMEHGRSQTMIARPLSGMDATACSVTY